MENKTLSNIRLLILRQPRDSQELSSIINRHLGKSLVWPALTINQTTPPTKSQLLSIKESKICIFTSKPAVKYGYKWMEDTKQKNILAIGNGTAQQLYKQGCDQVITPKVESSEGLLALNELSKVDEKKIIIFKGKGGRDLLLKSLKNKGAKVITQELYQRTFSIMNTNTADKIKTLSPNFILITSQAVAQSLNEADDKFKFLDRNKIIILVPSERIKKTVIKMSFLKVINTNSMRDDKTVETLQRLNQ